MYVACFRRHSWLVAELELVVARESYARLLMGMRTG
jgi:hypothetical protein